MGRVDSAKDVFMDVFLAVTISVTPFLIGMVWGFLAEWYVLPRLYSPGAPRLSYGQEFGVLLLMVVGPLGTIGGMSVVLARHERLGAATGLCLAAAFLAYLLLAAMWTEDVRRYGYEPTQLVVFPVPVLSTAALFGLGCVMAVVAVRHRSAEERRRV
jgi:hypothetical protein